MVLDPHDLHSEFPEYDDRIHDLKVSNAHFARLFDEYHEVNRQVQRVEQEVEHMSDFDLEGLKKVRLKLKDDLYQMLSA
ncbi:YdcH family protein [Rhodocyclaceae bacterium SMB388]